MPMKQQTLAMAADQSGYEQYRKPTRRDEFLATMEAIVPWAALCAVIEPHYPNVVRTDALILIAHRFFEDRSCSSVIALARPNIPS